MPTPADTVAPQPVPVGPYRVITQDREGNHFRELGVVQTAHAARMLLHDNRTAADVHTQGTEITDAHGRRCMLDTDGCGWVLTLLTAFGVEV